MLQDGRPVGLRGIMTDLSERKQLEEERLKAQKLESIGTLAGGIAHDFNNLLQGIFGYIAMARMTYDQKEKSLAMLEQAEKALHQSVNLTTQLLTFSKGGKPVRMPIALESVIENAAKFALSGSRTEYRMNIDPGLWHVNADAGQLGQVIQNIVLNADQAMPLGGVVKISARNTPANDVSLPSTLATNHYVVLSIEDNGVGISEEYLGKIFDPYFTTKEKGSGLGLATSYSIIRNHDGQIHVSSKIGKGSVFSIYLPAVPEGVEARTSEQVTPAAPTRTRVLVMDDEELIRNLARELLNALGHEVEVAAHGEESVAKYQAAMASGKPFGAVILDLTIRGGMGGADTVKRLREIDPGVRAIVSSGYSQDAVIADHSNHGFMAFLKKPYNVDELRNVLDSLPSR
jgi:two-component system cell cycle sensor histidine kinase/response regulator CckA